MIFRALHAGSEFAVVFDEARHLSAVEIILAALEVVRAGELPEAWQVNVFSISCSRTWKWRSNAQGDWRSRKRD